MFSVVGGRNAREGTNLPVWANPSGEGHNVANGQRRRVGTIRSITAVTLAAIGLFTAMAGLGRQSWPLGAVGVAMVILAVALLLTSSFRGADRAFVVGKAHVLEVTEAPATLTHGRCEMHLQIEAAGHPPASVRVRDPRVPVAKWPQVGDVLPIRVAVDDLRRVKVLWDETLTHTQRRQDYGDRDYDGVTADNEPIYDDQQPRTYRPDFAPSDARADRRRRDERLREEPGVQSDERLREEPGVQSAERLREEPGVQADDFPEGPPLPQRHRVSREGRPSPRPRPAPADAPVAVVLEGEVLTKSDEAPRLRVDVIDFSDAPPSVVSDVPPYAPPRQGTGPDPATGETPAYERSRDEPGVHSDERSREEPGVQSDEPPAEWPPQSQTQEPAPAPQPEKAALPDDAVEPAHEDLTPEPAQAEPVQKEKGPLHHGEPVDMVEPVSAGRSGSVHGVGITMLVADVGRSVAFYRDLLGFDELDSGRGNAVLVSGSTRIVLRKADDLTPGNRHLTHMNLEVDDLDSVYHQLLDRGVSFTYAPRVVNRSKRLELWAAAFRDPDGHAINLTEWRSRS
jgi:catechol 2,3-dioxygenase-like lactoylglutathione lyase family enzyme